jgi:hypothetical protein
MTSRSYRTGRRAGTTTQFPDHEREITLKLSTEKRHSAESSALFHFSIAVKTEALHGPSGPLTVSIVGSLAARLAS